MPKRIVTAQDELFAVRRKLLHYTSDWVPSVYLDTGSRRLNNVLGSPMGIPYGKFIEIAGAESGGKTRLALYLTGLAQEDGANTAWYDAEATFDPLWAERCRVDNDSLVVIEPYQGKFGRKQEERISYAEDLLRELEALIKTWHAADPACKNFIVIDSVTGVLVKAEAEKEVTETTRRAPLAGFLSKFLRRWVAFCQSTNTVVVFINQLRMNPAQMFGNPEYTPGGRALKFYSHVRINVKRGPQKGDIPKSGRIIGIKGIIRNVKNKAGGTERAEVGYKFYHSGKTAFVDVRKIKRKDNG